MVRMLKNIAGNVIFRDDPAVKQELWGGEFWDDKYFAAMVGDKSDGRGD